MPGGSAGAAPAAAAAAAGAGGAAAPPSSAALLAAGGEPGWFSEVAPNTSQRGMWWGGDKATAEWQRRPDDQHVVQLREYFRRENGIRGLEVCRPAEVERAAELFWRDGFVCVRDALSPAQLARARAATRRELGKLLERDPRASFGHSSGNSHRYSYAECSATKQMLHEPEWCELIDLPTTTPILQRIFGSKDQYQVCGAGGDVLLPGGIEYQRLHRDIGDFVFDPHGKVTLLDMPVPHVNIAFTMVDFTHENGPIRYIRGTHRTHAHPPGLAREPAYMKLSTLCPLPAGSAIFRDRRAWHGGTPNVSGHIRAMASVDYVAPWFRLPTSFAGNSFLHKTLPHARWKELSPHGRRVASLVCAAPGEAVPGAGFMHPDPAELRAHVARARRDAPARL